MRDFSLSSICSLSFEDAFHYHCAQRREKASSKAKEGDSEQRQQAETRQNSQNQEKDRLCHFGKEEKVLGFCLHLHFPRAIVTKPVESTLRVTVLFCFAEFCNRRATTRVNPTLTSNCLLGNAVEHRGRSKKAKLQERYGSVHRLKRRGFACTVLRRVPEEDKSSSQS